MYVVISPVTHVHRGPMSSRLSAARVKRELMERWPRLEWQVRHVDHLDSFSRRIVMTAHPSMKLPKALQMTPGGRDRDF